MPLSCAACKYEPNTQRALHQPRAKHESTKSTHFNVTLSYKVAFCSEFGGISMENSINIIDIHQETCYNLWGANMITRFINILNLEATHEEVKEILTLMFKAYQPDKNIKW